MWVAGWLTMASVYRPLSPTESLLYWVNATQNFWLFWTGYQPPPHSWASVGKRTRIAGDCKPGGNPDSRQNSSVLSSTPLPWLDGSMEEKKHRSLVIRITLQKRNGIDCVGKQFWEERSEGPFYVVHVVCVAISNTVCRQHGVKSPSSPHIRHHLQGGGGGGEGGGRQGKSQDF